MATYFVDAVNGNNGNTGLDMDNAWQTLAYAMTNAVAQSTVWIRRNLNETAAALLAPANQGVQATPHRFIGWPRAEETGPTGASWTNGSTTVDLVTGLTMDREKHVGRMAVAPDGYEYIITQITDANTFIIDREYSGATVTTTAGAFTINEDPDYDEAQLIDDST